MNAIVDFDVVAYTDGAYRIDVDAGGWGVRLITDEGVKELYGGEFRSDANRMELKAAVTALENVKYRSKVVIYSDSSYVVDGVLSWLPTWRREWELSDNVPRTNSDLWQAVRKMVNRHEISWCWVKGHSINQGNRRADILATQGMEELIGENYGM